MNKLRAAYELVRDTFNEWSEDKVPRLGAALAYYSMFSLAPLLIIAIAIATLFFGETSAQSGVMQQVEAAVGPSAAKAIGDMLSAAHQTGGYTAATVIGIVILLVGAGSVFVQLQDALNTIWKVTPRPGRPIWEIVRERFLSFLVVLGTGILLLASVVVSTTLSVFAKYWGSDDVVLWQVINGITSFLFITVLFALLFKVLPDARVAWSDVWVGAAFTALLFTAGKYLIGLYLGQGTTASAFGAAGSLVIVLVWVYYSAQIILFGAEFTRVYADKYGAGVVPADHALPVTVAARARQGMPAGARAPDRT
jgi:membrane protein